MQKGFAPIIVIIGILVIAALTGGAYYLGTQKPPAPTPVINQRSKATPTTVDETADWKTYTNTLIGFALKYPPDAGEYKDLNIYPQYFGVEKQTYDSVGQTVAGYSIRIKRWGKLGNRTFDTYSLEFYQVAKENMARLCAKSNGVISDRKQSTLLGKEAFIYDFKNCPMDLTEYNVLNEGYLYTVTYEINGSDQEKLEYKNIVAGILSTFKFLDQK